MLGFLIFYEQFILITYICTIAIIVLVFIEVGIMLSISATIFSTSDILCMFIINFSVIILLRINLLYSISFSEYNTFMVLNFIHF